MPGVRKIAVLRPNAVGDFVFALPALHTLKRAYPGAELVLLGLPWHAGFLAHRPGPVDRVVVVPPLAGIGLAPGADDGGAARHFVAAMRAERFDIACQMYGGGRYANPLVVAFGARLSVGARSEDAAPLDRWVRYAEPNNRRLALLEIAALAGASDFVLGQELAIVPGDRRAAAAVLQDLSTLPDTRVADQAVMPQDLGEQLGNASQEEQAVIPYDRRAVVDVPPGQEHAVADAHRARLALSKESSGLPELSSRGDAPDGRSHRPRTSGHCREAAPHALVPGWSANASPGGPLVLLQPGATDARRCWPPAHFAAVGNALAGMGARIVVNGTAAEAARVGAVVAAMRAPALDLSGKLGLGGLCGLIERAACVVSNDTGPLHLALAIGTPCVGIFWLTNLIEGMPLRQGAFGAALSLRQDCPVCGAQNLQQRCAHDVSFVADVPVERVYALAVELLSQQGHGVPATRGGIL